MTPMFERRHYKNVASRMKSLRHDFVVDEDWKLVIVHLGHMFTMDNARFKWNTFKEACGYNEPVRTEQPNAGQYPLGQEVRPERRSDYYDANDRGEMRFPHGNGTVGT